MRQMMHLAVATSVVMLVGAAEAAVGYVADAGPWASDIYSVDRIPLALNELEKAGYEPRFIVPAEITEETVCPPGTGCHQLTPGGPTICVDPISCPVIKRVSSVRIVTRQR